MDEFFKVDDLLNFPKEDHIFSSTTDHSDHHHQSHHHNHYHHQQSQQFNSPSNRTDIKNHHNNNNISHHNTTNPLRCNNNNSSFSYVTNCPPHFSYDFTDQLCVPNDDVAELEWLSNFVDDSTDLTTADFTRTLISQSHTSSTTSAARSKRSRQRTWKASVSPVSSTTTSQIDRSTTKIQNNNNGDMMDDSSSTSGGVRRCTHCASEKTPQWRTGPMGPKTLCNACGVRYKSGRLVPEYRPAASPTFVLTQHSNSHRKVMELRRQKEVTIKQQNGCVYRHTRDYEIC